MVVTRSKAKLQVTQSGSGTTTTTSTRTAIVHPIPFHPRPYPSESPKTIKKKTIKTTKKSTYFSPAQSISIDPDIFQPPPEGTPRFGLVQEFLSHNLYFLCVQAILWNQTRGQQARPVLGQILTLYPTPEDLASADLDTLTALLYPIGLHNIRAARLIAFAKGWVDAPPCRERRYRRLDYPTKGCGRDVGKTEVLDEEDEREGWEVAHLPGMGAYALDSFRIFGRDKLREVEDVEGKEEWRSVLPLDKDLRAYLVWRWWREGWVWDMHTGKRRLVKEDDTEPIRGSP